MIAIGLVDQKSRPRPTEIPYQIGASMYDFRIYDHLILLKNNPPRTLFARDRMSLRHVISSKVSTVQKPLFALLSLRLNMGSLLGGVVAVIGVISGVLSIFKFSLSPTLTRFYDNSIVETHYHIGLRKLASMTPDGDTPVITV